MKVRLAVHAATAAVFSLGAASALAAQPRDSVTVLEGAHVLDGTGAAPIEDGRVVIRGNTIACVGARNECESPEGSQLVSLSHDSFLLPGLVDAHVHFAQTGWYEGRPDTLDLRDLHPFDETQADLEANPDRYFRSYLCSGVTSVFDVGGFPWSWDLRALTNANPMAPRVAAAGPLITHAPREKLNLPGEQEMILLSDEEAGRAAVRYMAANDTDAVKVWFLPVPPEHQADIDARVIAVADEASRLGLRLIVHATSLREAKVAVRSGAHLLVHGVDDQLVDEEFLSLAKRVGTIYTPTLLVSDGYLRMFEAIKGVAEPSLDDPNGCIDERTRERILKSPTLRDHPEVQEFQRDFASYRRRLAESYERKLENLRRVHQAGIPIAMGTDAGNPGTFHGPSVYAEVEAMQAAGIESSELIVMATRNGARAMGREDFGVLLEGKLADLIVVAGNPLEDVKHLRGITHVMREGRLFRIDELTGDRPR
jgi:imidazolonepropionase-like amidohydrolase